MEVYGFIWPLFLNLLAHLFHIHSTLFSSGCQDNSKQYAFTSVFGFIKFAHIQCTSSTFFFFLPWLWGMENQTDASSLP